MPKTSPAIPVNYFATEHNRGMSIERISIDELEMFAEAHEAHRHDSHSFMLLETGRVTLEIDFKKHLLKAPAIIYLHPNQVHLVLDYKNVTVCSLAITDENLRAEYLPLLEDIVPAKPLPLKKNTFSALQDAVSFCILCSEMKRTQVYNTMLKDSCNAVAAIFIAEYLGHEKSNEKFSRFETVNKKFIQLLKKNFASQKRPADYAAALNISVSYLNECVVKATGRSVSYQISQRIILEAKRMLYHGDSSVKEISAALGYDDHHYFSRLFTKVAGLSPTTFRNKNHD